MIKKINELASETLGRRQFEITTQSGYGLSTVSGFVKYQLGTSKFRIESLRPMWTDEYAVYSVYDGEENRIALLYLRFHENRFFVAYQTNALASNNMSIKHVS